MGSKIIFLSHIHEEKELAVAVQTAIEAEFAGFVDVFVSSDGHSIPAGSNFLKRIEDGLVSCAAAVYLISPKSVLRHWVSFELGAVWIRNSLSTRAGHEEIPTIPLCHSQLTPAQLPAPLNNLNAIVANQSSQLEFAFRSLQRALGGKGQLRTDFDALAVSVSALERQYTLGANVAHLIRLLAVDTSRLVQDCEKAPASIEMRIKCGFRETSLVQQLKALEQNELAGHIRVTASNGGVMFGSNGAINGADVEVALATELVVKYKALLSAGK